MRAQYPNCEILLFSVQAATLDLLKGARAQGYDFRLLQKPVHPSEFLSEIGQLFTGLLQSLPLAENRRIYSLVQRNPRPRSANPSRQIIMQHRRAHWPASQDALLSPSMATTLGIRSFAAGISRSSSCRSMTRRSVLPSCESRSWSEFRIPRFLCPPQSARSVSLRQLTQFCEACVCTCDYRPDSSVHEKPSARKPRFSRSVPSARSPGPGAFVHRTARSYLRTTQFVPSVEALLHNAG